MSGGSGTIAAQPHAGLHRYLGGNVSTGQEQTFNAPQWQTAPQHQYAQEMSYNAPALLGDIVARSRSNQPIGDWWFMPLRHVTRQDYQDGNTGPDEIGGWYAQSSEPIPGAIPVPAQDPLNIFRSGSYIRLNDPIADQNGTESYNYAQNLRQYNAYGGT